MKFHGYSFFLTYLWLCTTYLVIKIAIYFYLSQNISNMPCGIFYYATCHNFKPSLTTIMNNGDQYFEEKKLHGATCHILING
jgi:hypothetical protein